MKRTKKYFSLREILGKITFQLSYYAAFSQLCISTVIQLSNASIFLLETVIINFNAIQYIFVFLPKFVKFLCMYN